MQSIYSEWFCGRSIVYMVNYRSLEVQDIPLQFLKEPKEDTSEAEDPMPIITDMGESQNNQPELRAMYNPAWHMAKAWLEKAKKYIPEPTMAPEGVQVQQGPKGGW